MRKWIWGSLFMGICLTVNQIFAANVDQGASTQNGSQGASIQNGSQEASTDDGANFFKTEFFEFLMEQWHLNSRTETVRNDTVLIIQNNEWNMLPQRHHLQDLLDNFTKQTQIVATIFVKSGSNFQRDWTSLKTERGQSAIRTKLDPQSPAYQNLMQGVSYTGKTELFGKDYTAYYGVIKNEIGQIIGAYFLGIPQN